MRQTNADGQIMHALGHCRKYYILSKTEIRLQGEAVTRRKTDNTMTERNRENNDLQNIKQKTRGCATRTPQKPG